MVTERTPDGQLRLRLELLWKYLGQKTWLVEDLQEGRYCAPWFCRLTAHLLFTRFARDAKDRKTIAQDSLAGAVAIPEKVDLALRVCVTRTDGASEVADGP